MNSDPEQPMKERRDAPRAKEAQLRAADLRKDKADQLRTRLLQMIVDNERRRRAPPSTH